jgi:hypothetical protein
MGLVFSTIVATKILLSEPTVQKFVITTTDEIKGISNVLMKEVENAHKIRQEQNTILSDTIHILLCGFGIAWLISKIDSYFSNKKDDIYDK